MSDGGRRAAADIENAIAFSASYRDNLIGDLVDREIVPQLFARTHFEGGFAAIETLPELTKERICVLTQAIGVEDPCPLQVERGVLLEKAQLPVKRIFGKGIASGRISWR